MDEHKRKFSNTLTSQIESSLSRSTFSSVKTQTTCVFVTWASFNPNSMHTVAFNTVKSKADFARKQLNKIRMLSMPVSRTRAAKTRPKIWKGIDAQTWVNTAQNDANSCLLAHVTSIARMLFKGQSRISGVLTLSCGRTTTLCVNAYFLGTRKNLFSKISGNDLIWFEFRAVKIICLLGDAVAILPTGFEKILT